VLIAAASGRALAASARRGGFAPVVLDRFGDLDTLAVADKHVFADLSRPIDGDKLVAAIEVAAEGRAPIGIVCGTGFEDRADLLARLNQRWPLLGASADTVAALKDPVAFAALCREVQVPHPEISLAAPSDPDGWLVKRVGGAGCWHIRAAADGKTGEGAYFQRRAAGRPVSAALLGDGRRVMVLGFSEQWSAPTAAHPYRYGGAVRPANLNDRVRLAMEAALGRLASRVAPTGLSSADFLVEGEDFQLLEINPRPGATLDLFEPEDGSLFALHIAACNGVLPDQPPLLAGAMAGAIVYAGRTIVSVPVIAWPDWAADRPVPGSSIGVGQPACSVYACAETVAEARRLLDERCAAIQALMTVPS
jgi:predicted ATP-grasp superfamily ATP-dependent carboligase